MNVKIRETAQQIWDRCTDERAYDRDYAHNLMRQTIWVAINLSVMVTESEYQKVLGELYEVAGGEVDDDDDEED